MNEAIEILSTLKYEIEKSGNYNVSELSDNHSRAFHGACILINAIKYLKGEEIVYGIYQPLFTR